MSESRFTPISRAAGTLAALALTVTAVAKNVSQAAHPASGQGRTVHV